MPARSGSRYEQSFTVDVLTGNVTAWSPASMLESVDPIFIQCANTAPLDGVELEWSGADIGRDVPMDQLTDLG